MGNFCQISPPCLLFASIWKTDCPHVKQTD
jgi:hypothetical protein